MATIIKSHTATGPDAAPFKLTELAGTPAGQAQAAQTEAARIVAEARREATEIRRQAEAEARSAAHQVLDRQVGCQLDSLTAALEATIAGLATAKTQWLAHWERTAVQLATAIAQRVIRREVQRTPEITLTLVREALELASASGELQLRLHPADFESLGSHVRRISDELTRLGKVQLVSDESIERGGCRVDSRFGTIDQQFAAQLARIEQELT
jgi:flagellar assembly protein FliH